MLLQNLLGLHPLLQHLLRLFFFFRAVEEVQRESYGLVNRDFIAGRVWYVIDFTIGHISIFNFPRTPIIHDLFQQLHKPNSR